MLTKFSILCLLIACIYPLYLNSPEDYFHLGSTSIYEKYFSDDYYSARQSFRENTRRQKGELFTLDLGIKDLDLTIDVAIWKRNKKGVYIHVSGTHGVEGFAGSSIQNAVLNNATLLNSLPTLVLVHALNPYGFAKLRRFNENGVDLNRNFLNETEFQELQNRDPNEYGYMDLNEMFNPSSSIQWGDFFWLKAVYCLFRYRFEHFKTALVTGTYHMPKGLFYGGSQLEKSNQLLKNLILQEIKTTEASSVVLVDIHTGLGSKGVDSLLTFDPLSTELAQQLYDDKDDNGSASKTSRVVHPKTSKIPGVSQGYQDAKGYLISGLQTLFPNAKTVVGIVQEFGTVSPVHVFKALREENAMYHHQPENRLVSAQNLRDVFYLHQSSFWKHQVVLRGLDVFSRSIQYLNQSLQE